MESSRTEGLQREERTEVLLRFLSKVQHIEALQDKKIEEIFSNEASKNDFISHLDPQDAIEILNGINGILRHKRKEDWKIDGGKVFLTGFLGEHIPPRQEDKLNLLLKTFEGAKIINAQQRPIEDIALLLSANINEIHPYQDANGRTSRFIYTLLNNGYTEESKKILTEVLGNYGRDHIDVNPAFIAMQLRDLIINEIGLNDPQKNPDYITNWLHKKPFNELGFKAEIPGEEKDDFIRLLRNDYEDMSLALFLYVREHPKKETYTKKFPSHTAIIMEQLVPDLEMSDLQQITDYYWNLKRRHSEILTDCIVNPQKPEYSINQEGKKITLLDYFKNRVEEEAKRRQKN